MISKSKRQNIIGSDGKLGKQDAPNMHLDGMNRDDLRAKTADPQFFLQRPLLQSTSADLRSALQPLAHTSDSRNNFRGLGDYTTDSYIRE